MNLFFSTKFGKKKNKVCSLMKTEETPYIVSKYPHFLPVWTKFGTFYFQIFDKKDKKRRGNHIYFASFCDISNELNVLTV